MSPFQIWLDDEIEQAIKYQDEHERDAPEWEFWRGRIVSLRRVRQELESRRLFAILDNAGDGEDA